MKMSSVFFNVIVKRIIYSNHFETHYKLIPVQRLVGIVNCLQANSN